MFVAVLLGALELVSSRGSATAATAVPISHSSIEEGPGGRQELERWTLAKDPANRGIARGFSKGLFSGQKVNVPDTVNPLPVTGPAGELSYEGSVAWYRTRLRASTSGLYAVRFESVNFRASVWIDGRAIGSHKGTYLPFEFVRQLSAGNHTLVVRVDWRDPQAQTQAGFHRTWFNFGGINGEVSIRPLAESELLNPNLQTVLQPDSPSASAATVTLSVEVRNNGPDRTITPSGTLHHGDQTIPLSFTGAFVRHGKSVTLRTRVTVETPALWSPADPNLYELSIAVANESGYSAWVGLRQLTWRDGLMFLNGQHLILHGASIQEEARGHGDSLSPADQDKLVRELEQIGANATRSQHPLDPALLERLDAAGILVWEGVGPVDPAGDWTDRTPSMLAAAEQEVRTTVRQDQLHPSIITWNLANEIAGNGHPGGQAQYVRQSARWLHSEDPGRMVALDVWGDHPPSHAGPIYADVDAVSETDYSGWYDSPFDTPTQLTALINQRLAAMHHTFGGKVQIISEFGAESNSLNPAASPGGYTYQSRLLVRHIDAYEHDPSLSGMLVWDLRDFALTPTFAGGSISSLIPGIKLIKGLNQKGLFTYENRPKPAEPVVARLFAALPQV
jgi:Glycosyl hydrolases family 2, TIM barrel domain/Glycosyl hydrolases family 2, sugar binding domain/Glycosyl hydrolases family 2